MSLLKSIRIRVKSEKKPVYTGFSYDDVYLHLSNTFMIVPYYITTLLRPATRWKNDTAEKKVHIEYNLYHKGFMNNKNK